MSAPDLKGMIQVGFDVLTTTINEKTKKILAQIGSVLAETTDADNAEWWQHVGFASRPSKPEAKKKAAQAVVLRAGDHDVIVASQDLRGLELYGNLKAGETCTYAAGEDGTGQARTLWRDDGAITHFTTEGNVPGGKVIYSRTGSGIDADTGLMDGFVWAAPWGTVKFDQSGFHVVHESGAEFHLGGIAGMPAPLDQIATYCKIEAAAVTTTSSAQSLGAGTTQPLAFAAGTLALGTAIQAALTAIQACLTASSGGTVNAASVTAAATAVTAAQAALATALLAVPAGTSSSA